MGLLFSGSLTKTIVWPFLFTFLLFNFVISCTDVNCYVLSCYLFITFKVVDYWKFVHKLLFFQLLLYFVQFCFCVKKQTVVVCLQTQNVVVCLQLLIFTKLTFKFKLVYIVFEIWTEFWLFLQLFFCFFCIVDIWNEIELRMRQ